MDVLVVQWSSGPVAGDPLLPIGVRRVMDVVVAEALEVIHCFVKQGRIGDPNMLDGLD